MVKPDVVTPLLANRTYACSSSPTETTHSGKRESFRIFSVSLLASSRVSMELIRLNHVDLPETRRRAAMTHRVELHWLAFGIVRGSVELPVAWSGDRVARLP